MQISCHMETNTKPSVHIGFKMEPKDYLKLGVFAAKTGTSRSLLAKEATLQFLAGLGGGNRKGSK